MMIMNQKEPGQEYGKTIFETDENIIHSLDDDQKSADQFEINGQQNTLHKNNTDNTYASNTSNDSLPHTGNSDLQRIKQLQQQDENITKLIAMCRSSKNNETPYKMDEHSIIYRKIKR